MTDKRQIELCLALLILCLAALAFYEGSSK